MNKILIIFLILLFTLSGCGFKVKNQSELINFNIVEFIGNGEQRVNFRIKNKILRNLKEDNPKNIRLIINTTKEKKDKEKHPRASSSRKNTQRKYKTDSRS